MQQIATNPAARPTTEGRVKDLFREYKESIYKHTDRLFAILMAVQWLAGIIAAVWISPRAWVGATSQIHLHVWAAIFLGSAISFFPIALALIRPGKASTRYAIAIGQMLMGALLIHLSGGRIETHFHVFGSLAFLAFYRDWRVLVPATLVVVLDHFLRGVFYPQSVFGVLTASNWRWLEHAGWVVFIDIFLVISCLRGTREMRDIAERTTALETGAERDRFFTLSLDMLCIAGLDGYFRRLNPAFEEILGFSEAELLSKSYLELVHPEDRAATLAELQNLAAGKVTANFEIRFLCQNGTYKWLAWTVASVPAEGLLYAVARDVTERRRMEADVAQARDAALESTRLKSEFLANMSHEIRTPMNGIIGMTELALDTELTPDQREYLDMVKLSSESLLGVINDILDFSKVEAGKLELNPEEFDFQEGVGDTLKSLAVRAEQKGLELTYDVLPGVPEQLIGDPHRLRQILVNLVGNAIKFTEAGEVTVLVEREAQTDDEVMLHFKVRDTGIGIPPAKQKLIFKAFTQADGSTTRKYGGTGLGLAITSQIVELMGGRIWVESPAPMPEPDADCPGSTFHFTVPLGLARTLAAKTSPANLQSLRDLPALVVDDNATNRRILQETLKNWRMKPATADGGRAALSELKRAAHSGKPYKLVLLDANMPEMDGFAVAEQIRQTEELVGATVMMLSSADQNAHVARCRELELAVYLIKPVQQSELLAACRRALGAHTPQDAAPSSRPAPAVPSRSETGLRLLLAEDNLVNQRLAVRVLEKQGHTIEVATNGRDALAAFERERFDVVLMDVQMPEMNGFEATAAIRQRELSTGAHTPVIAMTAHAMKGDRERCLAAGMDDYISKPIHAGELLQIIERLVPAPVEGEADTREHDTEHDWNTDAGRQTATEFDPTALLARTDGDLELARELVALFLEDSPKLLFDIREAVARGDAQALERAAHTMKASVGFFPESGALEILKALEKMGAEKDLSRAADAPVRLEREIERMTPALAAFTLEKEYAL